MTNQAFCQPRPPPFSMWCRKLQITLFSAANEACFYSNERWMRRESAVCDTRPVEHLWKEKSWNVQAAPSVEIWQRQTPGDVRAWSHSPPGWSAFCGCCWSARRETATRPRAWRSSRCTRGWLGCCRTTGERGTPSISHKPPGVDIDHHTIGSYDNAV